MDKLLDRVRRNDLTNTVVVEEDLKVEEAVALAEALKDNTHITHLDLTCSMIGVEGAVALADALKLNAAVTQLDLNYIAVGAEGAAALVEMLDTNGSLVSLRCKGLSAHHGARISALLTRNKLHHDTVCTIAKCLWRTRHLECWDCNVEHGVWR